MRTTRLSGVLAALVIVTAAVGCASAEEQATAAHYETVLAIERIDGVLHASTDRALLDITAPPADAASAALAVFDLLVEREGTDADPRDVGFELTRPGVLYPEIELTVPLAAEYRERLADAALLWATLVHEGYGSVRLNLFPDGSEFGFGVLSVRGWYESSPVPDLASGYTRLLESFGNSGLPSNGMQLNLDLGVGILNDDASYPVPAALIDAVGELTRDLDSELASIKVSADGVRVKISGAVNDDGIREPLSDAERAHILSAFDEAGLLSETLTLVATAPLGKNVTIWGGE